MALATALALDIGGTKLAAGVVHRSGRVDSFRTCPTQVDRGVDDVLRRLLALGADALAEAGLDRAAIDVVGIGCGGPLDTARGTVHGPPNLPGWDDVPLTDVCAREFGRPAHLENDGVAAAIGEYAHGSARGAGSVVYLTVSTGVGGGVVIGGEPLRGRHGNGGELGHMVVVHDGRRCPCGGRGCLEAYVSGTSIAARARERLDHGAVSSLRQLPRVTAAEVARAARHGDRLARELWLETCQLLGTGIASLVNVFEPDVVVLGGGVTRAGAQLFDPVRERVSSSALVFGDLAVPIRPAQLGDTVGVVGAATAAFLHDHQKGRACVTS